jgi:hypothetical protein
MVSEDAHWIDPTSRELPDLAVERVRNLPVLLILTFRPEFQPPWDRPAAGDDAGAQSAGPARPRCFDREGRRWQGIAHEAVDRIGERTDGVPLFVEELTKSVLESGLLREEVDRYVLDGTLPLVAIRASGSDAMLAGRFASSRSHFGEALALYDTISHRSLVGQSRSHPQVICRRYLSIVLFCLGFLAELWYRAMQHLPPLSGWLIAVCSCQPVPGHAVAYAHRRHRSPEPVGRPVGFGRRRAGLRPLAWGGRSIVAGPRSKVAM